jgi:hypothetical protein
MTHRRFSMPTFQAPRTDLWLHTAWQMIRHNRLATALYAGLLTCAGFALLAVYNVTGIPRGFDLLLVYGCGFQALLLLHYSVPRRAHADRWLRTVPAFCCDACLALTLLGANCGLRDLRPMAHAPAIGFLGAAIFFGGSALGHGWTLLHLRAAQRRAEAAERRTLAIFSSRRKRQRATRALRGF